MYIMHVNIRVKPECVDAFIAATRANARASVKEPGIARFDVLQEVEDPTRFKLVEVYRSEADVAKHKETEHYAAWIQTAGDMMAEPRTRVFYRNCFPEDADWD
jgi:quinol monooxygenase YgiN